MSIAGRVLTSIVNRDRFNDSRFYEMYCRLRHPEHWRRNRRSRDFYRVLFEKTGNDLVFDIGANAGHMAVLFASAAEKVVCLEPDPDAARAIRRRFCGRACIEVVEKGVSCSEGTAEFIQFEEGGPYNTLSTKWARHRESSGESRGAKVTIQTTTLDGLIAEFGKPNYIKVDVEGFELSVLRGLSQSVPLLSFECNMPLFEVETIECIRLIQNLSDDVTFNWLTEHAGTFVSPEWVSAEDAIREVRSSQHGCLELFCATRGMDGKLP